MWVCLLYSEVAAIVKHYWVEGFQRTSFVSRFISRLRRRNKTPIFRSGDLTHEKFLVSHFALLGDIL